MLVRVAQGKFGFYESRTAGEVSNEQKCGTSTFSSECTDAQVKAYNSVCIFKFNRTRM